MRKLTAWAALVLVLGTAALAKDTKKKGATLVQIPDQTVDLPAAPEIVAQQPCANWGRAAALEAMLAAQGVALDQEFWAFRLDGGKMCFDSWGDPVRLAKEIDGEHVLEDGRRVVLALSFAPGAPTAPGALIARLKQGRTVMLVWRGRPYLLSGLTYDEYIYPDGNRMYEFKELRLIDPQERGEERLVRFRKAEHELGELEGTLDITATSSTSQAWIRERQQTREHQPWAPERQAREPNRPWTPESRSWDPKAEEKPPPK